MTLIPKGWRHPADYDPEGPEPFVGTVVQGYLTRGARKYAWQAKLQEIPKGTGLDDGDAVAYYIKGDDGRYYECYAHDVGDTPVFRVVGDED